MAMRPSSCFFLFLYLDTLEIARQMESFERAPIDGADDDQLLADKVIIDLGFSATAGGTDVELSEIREVGFFGHLHAE